jgi:hypothetical protein
MRDIQNDNVIPVRNIATRNTVTHGIPDVKIITKDLGVVATVRQKALAQSIADGHQQKS